jgi:hypothetical protein
MTASAHLADIAVAPTESLAHAVAFNSTGILGANSSR